MNANTKEALPDQNNTARSIHSAVDHASSSAHNAIDKAMGVADSATEWLSEQGNSVKAAPRRLLTTSSDYVAAHPLKALGIAVVAGVILSKIAL